MTETVTAVHLMLRFCVQKENDMTKLMASEAMSKRNLVDKIDVGSQLQTALQSVDAGKGHSETQVFNWLDDWASGQKRPIPNPDVLPDE